MYLNEKFDEFSYFYQSAEYNTGVNQTDKKFKLTVPKPNFPANLIIESKKENDFEAYNFSLLYKSDFFLSFKSKIKHFQLTMQGYYDALVIEDIEKRLLTISISGNDPYEMKLTNRMDNLLIWNNNMWQITKELVFYGSNNFRITSIDSAYLPYVNNNKSHWQLSYVYPNPTKKFASFNLISKTTISLELYSILGQEVYKNKYSLKEGINSIRIDLKVLSIASGMYIISVKDLSNNRIKFAKVLFLK